MGLGILIITGLDACLIGISIIELAYYVLKNLIFSTTSLEKEKNQNPP